MAGMSDLRLDHPNEAPENGAKVVEALNSSEFDTALGKFRFDGKGDPNLPPYVFYRWGEEELRTNPIALEPFPLSRGVPAGFFFGGAMNSTGPRNLITDVAGISVGHAHDEKLASGVTVVLGDSAAVTAATIFGGAPGTRELDAIDLRGSVGVADAIVLSGGSAFGLDAASGVQSYLREEERGFSVGPVRVPVVPQAILFDLINGGDKVWGRYSPYREMGFQAAASAGKDFALGSAGAGLGAIISGGEGRLMRGGLGSASEAVSGLAKAEGTDVFVGALAAVNAVGSVTVADTHHFWAAPFERGAEFGGLGSPHPWPSRASRPVLKFAAPERANTTLCVVATDAAFTHVQCKRLATMAGAGVPRAIFPAFSSFDGDIVFGVATGKTPLKDSNMALPWLGAAAANCLTCAIARGVYEASGCLPNGTPAYRNLFASR
jgi:L-aminopeptidase/D-esterase-like protein